MLVRSVDSNFYWSKRDTIIQLVSTLNKICHNLPRRTISLEDFMASDLTSKEKLLLHTANESINSFVHFDLGQCCTYIIPNLAILTVYKKGFKEIHK